MRDAKGIAEGSVMSPGCCSCAQVEEESVWGAG